MGLRFKLRINMEELSTVISHLKPLKALIALVALAVMGPVILLEVAQFAHAGGVVGFVLVGTPGRHLLSLPLAEVTFLAHTFSIVLGVDMLAVGNDMSISSQL